MRPNDLALMVAMMNQPRPPAGDGGLVLPTGSAVFNGTTSQGRYSQVASVFPGFPMTLAFWFQTGVVEAKEVFTIGNTASAVRQLGFRHHNNTFACYVPFAGLLGFTSDDVCIFDALQFQSVVFGMDGTVTKLWHDGTLITTDATAYNAGMVNGTTPTELVLGSNGPANSFAHCGMAHVSLHNAMADDAFAAAHAAGTPAGDIDNVINWWPLVADGTDLVGGQHMTLTDVAFISNGPTINY